MSFCQARLAYYKAPGYIAFIDDLPLTATQKMKRGELKTIALACMAQAGDASNDGPASVCFDLRNLKKRDA